MHVDYIIPKSINVNPVIEFFKVLYFTRLENLILQTCSEFFIWSGGLLVSFGDWF